VTLNSKFATRKATRVSRADSKKEVIVKAIYFLLFVKYQTAVTITARIMRNITKSATV
jgi:hypothetical protein